MMQFLSTFVDIKEIVIFVDKVPISAENKKSTERFIYFRQYLVKVKLKGNSLWDKCKGL